MENWLDFDYKQMSEVKNPMWNQQQPRACENMMPYPPMQGSMQPQPMVGSNPLENPPSPIPTNMPQPPIQQNKNYLQGYLKNHIGKDMRVQFLIGTGILTDRVGTLVSVGIDYIVLNPTNSQDIEICDLYSIKFVEVYGGKKEFPGNMQRTEE